MSVMPLVVGAEVFIKRLPLFGQSVVDSNHKVPFIGLTLNFYPQALSLLVVVSQRQLFMIYPLLSIEGNTPTFPSLSLSPVKLVALHSSVPVV